jgi:hypothetical protein
MSFTEWESGLVRPDKNSQGILAEASRIARADGDDPPEDQRWLHARLARLTTGRAPAPASARGGV